MSEETEVKDPLADLRQPFPPEVIGKLPKSGITLDFVGHAHVTDRLLTVDPHWNWEPLAVDDRGLPVYDNAGGLWIKLTVGGVTRLGYGDGPDPKQRIGDALRNAAMRFGVALDLWAKTDLESQLPNGDGDGGVSTNGTAPAQPQAKATEPPKRTRQAPPQHDDTPAPATEPSDLTNRADLVAQLSEALNALPPDARAMAQKEIKRDLGSMADLGVAELQGALGIVRGWEPVEATA